MGQAKVTAIIALAFVAACSVTNTGNPALPEGVELVRSKLEREAPSAPPAALIKLGIGSREFSFDLYGQLAAQNDGNLFVSPYSISSALAMVYAGAAGNTATELAAALHYDLPEPDLHVAFNTVDATLATRAHDGLQLSLMNAAWTANDVLFKPDYLDVLAREYGAGVYAIDVSGDVELVRERINGWVGEQTHGRILNLFPAGSFNAETALVLTNAIYFKAKWDHPFHKVDTVDTVFHAPAGDVFVPMMHSTGPDVRYMDGEGFQAFELPYKSPEVRMVFVLPDQGNDAAIEAGLSEVFASVRSGLHPTDLSYHVPRFSYRTEADLLPMLQALGVMGLFEAGLADMSRMTDVDLYVSAVLHQAFVLVDEEGTEAAAATGGTGTVFASLQLPITIVLDRPFLYAIYDEPTGQILFLGRFRQPSPEP